MPLHPAVSGRVAAPAAAQQGPTHEPLPAAHQHILQVLAPVQPVHHGLALEGLQLSLRVLP